MNKFIKYALLISCLLAQAVYAQTVTTGQNPKFTIVDINGGTIDGATIGASSPAAATFTTISQSGLTTFSSGAAITAGSYQLGRDADATNQMHFNVPTGATYEFSVNDALSVYIGATALGVGRTTSNPLEIYKTGSNAPVFRMGNDLGAGQLYIDANGHSIIRAETSAKDISFLLNATEGMRLTSYGDFIYNPNNVGEVANCAINYTAGTLTISGRGGRALSSTNPCAVGIVSNTTNEVASAKFTANVTVTDGATSQTDGNLFGITDANWASAMPLFVGVIYDGTTPYFTLSRIPLTVSGAAAGDLCQLTDTDCDAQSDVMVLTTGLTLASWVNLPITQVGWIQATYATTGGAWTFAESSKTGFNQNWQGVKFAMPLAQMGAATGTYLTANGGTAPLFTTNEYTYQWVNDNLVCSELYLNGDPGTDGATAVASQVAMPYLFPSGTMTTIYPGFGRVNGATTITGAQTLSGRILENTSLWELYYLDASAVHTQVSNSFFSNGARYILGSYCFSPVTN